MARKTKRSKAAESSALRNPLLRNPLAGKKQPSIEDVFAYDGTITQLLATNRIDKLIKQIEKAPELLGLMGPKFSHPSARVRNNASKALLKCAQEGIDISVAIPKVMNALSDEHEEVHEHAFAFLSEAICDEKSRDTVFPFLLRVLSDNPILQSDVALILSEVAGNGDDATRSYILDNIVGFMRSVEFQEEMSKNSPSYVRTARLMSLFFSALRSIEAVNEELYGGSGHGKDE